MTIANPITPSRAAVALMQAAQRAASHPAPHPAPHGVQTSIKGATRLGVVATALLFGILMSWAALSVVGGAVISQGQAVVRGKPQVVQQLDGGVVSEILVKTGDKVQAGEVLLRLDPTVPALNLAISEGRLAEALARHARLKAESLGLDVPDFTYAALPFPTPDTKAHEQGQLQIFNARAEMQSGVQAQLRERLAEVDTQIISITTQKSAAQDKLASIDADLANIEQLTESGLARKSQLSELQRARSDLLAQLAGIDAQIAQARTAGRDAELETLQTQRGFREEVLTDLRTATAEIDELTLDIVSRRAQLDRVDIRAPATGIVHEMQVATTGAVIAPGAVLLEIIPLEQGLLFEVRVDPRQIDEVYPGQEAEVKIASFDPQTTPRLVAAVESVSPAAILDARTGANYYRITLEVSAAELARMGDVSLVPGMPIEAFLKTKDRTVLDYLLQPLRHHLDYAMREN